MNLEDLKTAKLLCLAHIQQVEKTLECMEAWDVPDEVKSDMQRVYSSLHHAHTRLGVLIKRQEGL